MRALVLGGTGFLSSAITTTLCTAGWDVTVLTRGERPVPPECSQLRANRRDADALSEALQGRVFDLVVDAICYSPGDAHGALRALAGRVGHYVAISTDFVYGPIRRLPTLESDPTQALNHYGRQKAAAEEVLLQAWIEEEFPVSILRPPHIMGAGGHLGTGSLTGRDPMLLDRLERGGPLMLLDGGALLIQPVLHRDVAAACLAVAGRSNCRGQVYNVAGPDCVTTRRYYEVIAATVGVSEPRIEPLPAPLFVAAFPDRAPFAQHRMYSVELLHAHTGYRPATPFDHAVFEMVDWLQSSGAAERYSPGDAELQLTGLWDAYSDHVGRVLLS